MTEENQKTNKSAPSPGLVAQKWTELSAAIFHGDESALQVKETRRAFYAGVASLNEIYLGLGYVEGMDYDTAEHIVHAVCAELVEFGQAIEAGKA